IMKPSLARGELRCIGATTLNEYKKYIEKDAALERRFQSVIIGEPNREDTIKILKGLRDRYEAFHNAKITDEAILNAVDLSTQYINDRFQPDKSIDLIDEASAKVKIQASLSPDNIKLLENKLKSVQKEKTAAVSSQNFEKAAELRDIAKSLSDKIAEYKKAKKDDNLKPLVVTGEDIAEVVSKWTGIPLQSLKQSDSERLLHLEDELKKRVIGQDEAIHAVAQAIRRARAGMKDPKHPIGSFIFLGSTGVGKTELARALAEYMFGNESALVRFDMSEYMEKHEVSRLIGAPPGYVGYDEGGQLTDVIRRKPYSIILFDEIEKAHSDFFNILLQVLDDGRLTDGQGRTVDFTNCIIIMTSNLGAKYLNKNIKSLGFEITGKDIKEISFENQKTQILEEVKNTFRPEFINRIDEMIVFKPLEEKELKSIIKLLLKNTENKMNSLHVKLSVSDKAEEYLIKEGYSFEYGARPLKRLIQKKIENNISDMIIKGDLKGKRQLNIDLNNEKQLVFNTL
ncbi:MAG: ATP-dependent Clp protease ATP-binding subunit, partial [Dialister micraerophilus]|nr:ATP-dependent Clp protease ATP-binding subunit [Dialister micraerophilus]